MKHLRYLNTTRGMMRTLCLFRADNTCSHAVHYDRGDESWSGVQYTAGVHPRSITLSPGAARWVAGAALSKIGGSTTCI